MPAQPILCYPTSCSWHTVETERILVAEVTVWLLHDDEGSDRPNLGAQSFHDRRPFIRRGSEELLHV